MIAWMLCLALLMPEPGGPPPPVPMQSPGADALAAAAHDVFARKCVQCHGRDLAHPKAGFGYVTDLSRLVATGKYVVPGSLDESVLWQEIAEEDMPPDGAQAGPLTAQEAEAIRSWIVAGAPPAQAANERTQGMGAPAPRGLVPLIGRVHVLVVHFPVALLVVAALGEAWEALRRDWGVAPSVRVCLSSGAVAAVIAAGLGWVRALDGFAGPLTDPASLAGLHRWIGTGVGLAAPVVALLSERDVRRGGRSRGVRAAIVALGVLVGTAGHFGGLLTHGPEFFDL